jgi:hypothetical protein
MKEVNSLKNSSIYLEEAQIIRIANEAVFKAKEENKAHGLLEYFTKNKKLYYIMPNGEIEEKTNKSK